MTLLHAVYCPRDANEELQFVFRRLKKKEKKKKYIYIYEKKEDNIEHQIDMFS